MSTEEKVILTQCYHCNNKGNLDIVSTKDVYYEEMYESYSYYTLYCPVCQKIVLYEKYTCQGMEDYYGKQVYDEKTLFPENSLNFQGVPENIKSAFTSSLKVKSELEICALALRRVLEIICKDKNAKGKTLEIKIKDLVNRNILPPMFDKAAYYIRIIGNEGAHGDSCLFDRNDIEQLIDFVKSIIGYLYKLPYDISKMEEKINNRKAREENNE